jgi:two-component system OmpR family sensor kinase
MSRSMVGPSIRLRLTAYNGAVTAAILIGLGTTAYIALGHSLTDRLDAALAFEYEEVVERLRAAGADADLGDLTEAFRESYLLRVRDPAGRVLLESPALVGIAIPTGPPRSRPTFATVTLGRLGPHRILNGTRVIPPGPHTVQIAASLTPIQHELAELRAVLLAILPAGLLAAIGGGYWLAGRALAPVGRMASAARRISAANLDDRIEVANPRDELGRLAVTLNDMIQRLAGALASLRQFTADAAHELMTPLASIRTEAEVTLQALRTPEQYAETLASIVEEADRLARLADRLLTLAREDARAPSEMRPVALDALLRDAAEWARPLADRAGISLSLAALPPAVVAGDPDRLRPAFDNLLDNAIKYNQPGGTVHLSSRLDAGRVVVAITDTGIGIPGVALPRIFDRFYRVDPSRSRRTGGTGLGLSIARAIVRSHGGTIEAMSTTGRGTTFTVSLPVVNGPR